MLTHKQGDRLDFRDTNSSEMLTCSAALLPPSVNVGALCELHMVQLAASGHWSVSRATLIRDPQEDQEQPIVPSDKVTCLLSWAILICLAPLLLQAYPAGHSNL